MRRLSKPLQQQAWNKCRISKRIQLQYAGRFGPFLGPRKLEEDLDNAAALHNPDLIA
jgi:hypothetical protein